MGKDGKQENVDKLSQEEINRYSRHLIPFKK